MSNPAIKKTVVKKRKIKLNLTEKVEGNIGCEIDLDSFTVVNFNSAEYKLTDKNLTAIKSLGSGSYGSVELRRHDASKTIMAVKTIHISEGDKRNLKREIEVLKSSSGCSNVVKFYGAFFKEGIAFICMEAMDMCLTKFYKTVYDKMSLLTMPEEVLGAVTVCVLKALYFLKRELNVIHRDVKPSNVLINLKGEIKMCDFGISGCLVDSRARSYVGCLKYMAPELFDTEQRTNDGYDVRSDVWSLGISLLEISSGRVPFEDCETPFLFMDFLTRSDPPSPSSEYSVAFADFVSVCLQKDFHKRPYFDKLLEHGYPSRFLNTVDDEEYKAFVATVVTTFSS